MIVLSPHFTLVELIASPHRNIDNTPPAEAVDNLRLLASDTLESARYLLGPMHVTSGYRCPELNAAVGGRPNSQHMLGLACDFNPLRCDLREAVRRLMASGLVYDQLIYEYGAWLHVSHSPGSTTPRQEALMVGKWTEGRYVPLDLASTP